MAASIERVEEALLARGYLVRSIEPRADGAGVNNIVFLRDTPLATQAAALAYLATEFDWTDAGEVAWEKARTTEAAVEIILTAQDAQTRATRVLGLALMASLKESRRKVNELLAAVQSGDPARVQAVQPLETDASDADSFALLVQLLRSGAV